MDEAESRVEWTVPCARWTGVGVSWVYRDDEHTVEAVQQACRRESESVSRRAGCEGGEARERERATPLAQAHSGTPPLDLSARKQKVPARISSATFARRGRPLSSSSSHSTSQRVHTRLPLLSPRIAVQRFTC